VSCRLTDAEEEEGLHAEELFLCDLQQHKLLWEVLHLNTVLVHAGDMHPTTDRQGQINTQTQKGKQTKKHLAISDW